MLRNLRLRRRNLVESVMLKWKKQNNTVPSKEEEVKRVLIIFWGRLGELTLSTIFLQALRKKYKQAYICYILGGDGVETLKNDPNIDKLIPTGAGVYEKLIKEPPYDLAIDLYGRRYSAFMAYLSGARRLIISPTPQPNIRFHSIGTQPVRYKNKNVKDHFLNIAYAIGVKKRDVSAIKAHLSITRKEEAFARSYIGEFGLDESDFIVGIQPDGNYETWPCEKYAELGKQLAKNLQAKILIFQGPEQRGAAKKTNSLMSKEAILLPYLTIRDYLAVLSRCKLFITSAGGAEHAGPALGVPTITIVTPSECAYWVPRYKKSFYLPIRSRVKLKDTAKRMSKDDFKRPILSKLRKNFELTISVKRLLDFINSQKVKTAIKRRIINYKFMH